VCCAIPDSSENDVVADEANRCGVSVFRGSETDVLDRYYKAAKQIGADVILRVTSDCPLIDPEIAASVLQLRENENSDYACNNLPPTWPHGLDCEAFTFAWLERAAREAEAKTEREHVTPYIRHHRAARKANLKAPKDHLQNHRWTLDTPEDLEFLDAIFARIKAPEKEFSYAGPLRIAETDPTLCAMNAEHRRMSTDNITDGVIQKIYAPDG